VLAPELDALAADGVRFSAHTYSWCAPSRGAFMSGRYAPRSGFEGVGGPSATGSGTVTVFPLEYQFLPALLKDAGYRTVGAGKWHLGFARQRDLPENRGFDKWIGYLQGGEDYYARSATLHADNCTATRDFWFGTPGDGRPVADRDYWTGQYSTNVYGEWLVKQIDSHDAGQPLFVYAAFQAVHYPLQVPRPYFERFRAQGAGSGDCAWERQGVAASGFANGFTCGPNPAFPGTKAGLACMCNRLLVKAQVSALSEAVGNITAALRSNKGMWSTTLLAMMGDNGGPLDGAHSNAPLRGGKLNFFQGEQTSSAVGRTHRATPPHPCTPLHSLGARRVQAACWRPPSSSRRCCPPECEARSRPSSFTRRTGLRPLRGWRAWRRPTASTASTRGTRCATRRRRTAARR
jgi:arylsulfatase A-like enzyme